MNDDVLAVTRSIISSAYSICVIFVKIKDTSLPELQLTSHCPIVYDVLAP